MNEQITSVVFDLGRVLVDFSHEIFISFMNERGALIIDNQEFMAKTRTMDFEHGRISNDDFIEGVQKLLTKETSKTEIIQAWNSVFSPIDEMLELITTLKSRMPVYILSNTNFIHWKHLRETYQLDARSHGLLASCEVESMKPDRKIYKEAETRFSLEPKKTLFIDDIEKNVEGALACGWQGLTHHSVEATRSELLRRNILFHS